MWLAGIFSQSVACLFMLLRGSFAEQKFWILMKPKLILSPPKMIFFFMGRAFGVISKNSSPSLRSQRISTMLSSPSFIVLHFYI